MNSPRSTTSPSTDDGLLPAAGGAAPPISVTVGDAITVRGRDLAGELMGRMSFTEALLLDIDGHEAASSKVRVVDAILVAIMEHGITPSTLAGRLILDGAPEALQGAVAGGLLATGSRFLGTIEQSAQAVTDVCDEAARTGDDLVAAAESRVRSLRAAGHRVPGVGHNLHAATDPRVDVLLAVAEDAGVAGRGVEAFAALAGAASAAAERRLLPNAAGIIGALLVDLGYPPYQARGFALIARCAGLVAHCFDEQRRPLARDVWVSLHEQQSASVEGGAR